MYRYGWNRMGICGGMLLFVKGGEGGEGCVLIEMVREGLLKWWY